MDFDFRMLTGLIATAAAAGVLAASYVGAFLLGQARGRREAEAERRLAAERADYAGARVTNADRLFLVEGAVESVARAVERLAEVQRLALPDRARPGAAAHAEARSAAPRAPGHNTPS